MTQQPFSRPGAIDLSALKRPAPSAGASTSSTGVSGSSYSITVTEATFQELLEASTTAPVVMVFHSPRSPESKTYADAVVAAVEQYDGRFLAGVVDIDAMPQVAQALQITQVPLLHVLLDGRPVVQPLPGVLPDDEINTLLNQLGQQLTAQGVTGRHQPRSAAAPPHDPEAEPEADPRYAAAENALAADDVDGAVAEYQKLVDANPADAEAAAGLAMVKVLQRTQGVDLDQARAAAAEAPDDVDAQTLVADLDLLGGHVDDAFTRLVDLVRRTSDADRTRAREHLLGLFAAVGNDDQRVLSGRQSLASALY